MKWRREPGREAQCVNGHDMIDPYVNPQGHAVCKTCKRAQHKAWRERRAAAKVVMQREEDVRVAHEALVRKWT